MPDTPFAAALAGLGMTQAGFRRAVSRLGGTVPHPQTVSNWATGRAEAPGWALTVVMLLGELTEARRLDLTA